MGTTIQRKPIQSSSILSVGYDAETETLAIEFASMAVYEYFGVPQKVYDEMLRLNATHQSVGSFFSIHIRPCYKYICVRPKPPQAPKEKAHAQTAEKVQGSKPKARKARQAR